MEVTYTVTVTERTERQFAAPKKSVKNTASPRPTKAKAKMSKAKTPRPKSKLGVTPKAGKVTKRESEKKKTVPVAKKK
jgi:hypothetical protein